MNDKSAEIGHRISECRKEKGLTLDEIGKKLSLNKTSIRRYETGEIARIKLPIIVSLADIFDVNPEYLICKTDVKGHFQDHTKKMYITKIPVLGTVRAGLPAEAVENIIDYEEITQEMARSGDHFGLAINGDSMEPKFSEGDIIIVRKQNTVENGDIAVILINGEDATVKRFYRTEQGITLVATNPQYPPLFYTKKEVNNLPVSVIGKVVELRAKF